MFSGSGSTRHCVASNAPSERACRDCLLVQIVLNKIDTDAASLFRALCECVLSNGSCNRIPCDIERIATPSLPSRERVRCANAAIDSLRISSNKLNTAVHRGDCIAFCAASTTFFRFLLFLFSQFLSKSLCTAQTHTITPIQVQFHTQNQQQIAAQPTRNNSRFRSFVSFSRFVLYARSFTPQSRSLAFLLVVFKNTVIFVVFEVIFSFWRVVCVALAAFAW